MSKTITLRVSEDHYEAFKKYAQTENRKISNAIETLAMKQLENTVFVNDYEMAGIFSDEKLLARIRTGTKQVEEKKGRFVDAALSHEPVLISGKRGNAVLLSEDDWRSIQETLYLLSIPGMRDSIVEGLKTPAAKCAKKIAW